MNWIEGNTPWGTVKLPDGISVEYFSENAGAEVKIMNYTKRLRFGFAALLVLLFICMLQIYAAFYKTGLDTYFGADNYEAENMDIRVSKLDCNIINNNHILFSGAYLIEHSNGYQLRFRVAYSVPFLHENLFWETKWKKVQDSNGNDYSSFLTAYPTTVGKLNCIDVLIDINEEALLSQTDNKLEISAVCSEDSINRKNCYADMEIEIKLPVYEQIYKDFRG